MLGFQKGPAWVLQVRGGGADDDLEDDSNDSEDGDGYDGDGGT